MQSTVYFAPFEKELNVEWLLEQVALSSLIKKNDFVAVKLHFGEKGNKGFIDPKRVKRVVKVLLACGGRPFLTDTNTIYVGERANAVSHLHIAEGHGFGFARMGAPLIIAGGLRGNASVAVPIGKKHFQSVDIAQDIFFADARVFLSHFKGHELTGFGGTLKNMGMGCATRKGKYAMHNTVMPTVDTTRCTGCGACISWCPGKALHIENHAIVLDTTRCVGCGECMVACKQRVFRIPWNEDASVLQEKIVEYASAVAGKKNVYLNFLHHITPECDCFATKSHPIVEDIGILASCDPVALDQASLDMVNEKAGRDIFKEIHPMIDATRQLEYAERLGLGTREYTLQIMQNVKC